VDEVLHFGPYLSCDWQVVSEGSASGASMCDAVKTVTVDGIPDVLAQGYTFAEVNVAAAAPGISTREECEALRIEVMVQVRETGDTSWGTTSGRSWQGQWRQILDFEYVCALSSQGAGQLAFGFSTHGVEEVRVTAVARTPAGLLLPVGYVDVRAGPRCAECGERQVTGPDGSCVDCPTAHIGDPASNTCVMCPVDSELSLGPYEPCGWSEATDFSTVPGAYCDSVMTTVFSSSVSEVLAQGYNQVRFDIAGDVFTGIRDPVICEASWADAFVEVDLGDGAGWQPYLTSALPAQGEWYEVGSAEGSFCMLTTRGGAGYVVDLSQGAVAVRVTSMVESPDGPLPVRVVARAGPTCS
jgi:hypothetical protein